MGANQDFPLASLPPTPPPATPLAIEFGPLGEPSEALAAAWDALAANAAEVNVFAERWFAVPAARHLPQGAGAQLMQLWEGSGPGRRLIALLPLTLSRRYGRIPVRHVGNWTHYQCFLGTPLIRAGCERQAWTAALAALDRMRWARGFLHLDGLVEGGAVHRGLLAAAALRGFSCDTVHRSERALLESGLSPDAYYEASVRKKKRKEHKRLANRLAELGTVATRRLTGRDDLAEWCDAFLALERSGWKGSAGSALGSTDGTAQFFRAAIAGARAAGRLEMLRIDLDDRPIAMLVNFIAPPGAFSFKIAFDEAYARYSPGVLIEIENLQILGHDDVAWMDSCAVENHPMINSLWTGRRAIVRVTTPFRSLRSRALFHACRTAERASAALRRRAAARRASPDPPPGPAEKEPTDDA
ncbi:MAG: family N-acetyltransferase [Sphingomonas bacterium]|nr:GNAT family N-acetyltransferase [Sphingomonas bacterium]MDB5689684.1 family N-acetyltransferase [Sphingomonas bacterium]